MTTESEMGPMHAASSTGLVDTKQNTDEGKVSRLPLNPGRVRQERKVVWGYLRR
jgi:hypothetical protein